MVNTRDALLNCGGSQFSTILELHFADTRSIVPSGTRLNECTVLDSARGICIYPLSMELSIPLVKKKMFWQVLHRLAQGNSLRGGSCFARWARSAYLWLRIRRLVPSP